MPGSTPPTSQLDWLSSTTAMIVLFWSRATRDLLKSFGWGIAATPSVRCSDEVATFPRRPPHSIFRFRASGDTPHRPRGEAASHRSRLPLRRDPPSGRDLDDGTVSQLLEELAGEMNRPSDRKRRISGYGDRTWRRN